MVTRAVRRQLMRAISQRALRPRARENASMTREPGRTQCDAPCNNAMLCAREENKRQCMTCVTSPVSVCKMDTCILHCTEKLLEAFATVSLSPPRFFTFPLRLSSTVNSSLFCLRVFLIQWSRRSPADSTVWNGKQHVVRQSPSPLWRLEAACWQGFYLFLYPHSPPCYQSLVFGSGWIFHHKCQSSSEMTPALYTVTSIFTAICARLRQP